MRKPTAKTKALPRSACSLVVSREELERALAGEQRPAIRTRLRALLHVNSTQSIRAAAQKMKVAETSVARWMETIARDGLTALLVEGRRGRSKHRLTSAMMSDVRSELSRALKRRPNWRLKGRIQALILALDGRWEEAASCAQVREATVRAWLREVQSCGVTEFLAKRESSSTAPSLDIDAAALREIAAKEWNPRIRKRILAVAFVAEGMGYYDAGVAAGLNHPAVKLWVERVKQGGIIALGAG